MSTEVLKKRINWLCTALQTSKRDNERQQRAIADRDEQIQRLEAALAARDEQIGDLLAAQAPSPPELPVCIFEYCFLKEHFLFACRLPSRAARLPTTSESLPPHCPTGSSNTRYSPSNRATLFIIKLWRSGLPSFRRLKAYTLVLAPCYSCQWQPKAPPSRRRFRVRSTKTACASTKSVTRCACRPLRA